MLHIHEGLKMHRVDMIGKYDLNDLICQMVHIAVKRKKKSKTKLQL